MMLSKRITAKRRELKASTKTMARMAIFSSVDTALVAGAAPGDVIYVSNHQ